MTYFAILYTVCVCAQVKTEPIMMNDAQTEYDWRSVASLTEPESLGPCEPGTQVCLEGIVWQETSNGKIYVTHLPPSHHLCHLLIYLY